MSKRPNSSLSPIAPVRKRMRIENSDDDACDGCGVQRHITFDASSDSDFAHSVDLAQHSYSESDDDDEKEEEDAEDAEDAEEEEEYPEDYPTTQPYQSPSSSQDMGGSDDFMKDNIFKATMNQLKSKFTTERRLEELMAALVKTEWRLEDFEYMGFQYSKGQAAVWTCLMKAKTLGVPFHAIVNTYAASCKYPGFVTLALLDIFKEAGFRPVGPITVVAALPSYACDAKSKK